MDKYKVRLSKRAYRDVEGIFEYIALQKLDSDNAKKQTDRIWKSLKSLETFPQAHQERLEGRYAGKGYRQLLIDNFIAVYRIDEKSRTVQIVTVNFKGKNI